MLSHSELRARLEVARSAVRLLVGTEGVPDQPFDMTESSACPVLRRALIASPYWVRHPAFVEAEAQTLLLEEVVLAAFAGWALLPPYRRGAIVDCLVPHRGAWPVKVVPAQAAEGVDAEKLPARHNQRLGLLVDRVPPSCADP